MTNTDPPAHVDRDGAAGDEHGAGAARQLFAQAAEAARSGRYADAERMLQLALGAGGCTAAEALDLKARIHAQRGMHLLAEDCWRQAVELDAGNPVYGAALERLRRDRLPARRFVPFLSFLAFIALIAAVIVSGERSRRETVARLAEADAALRQLRMEIAAVRADDTRRREQDAAADAELRQAVSALGTDLRQQVGQTRAGVRSELRRLASAADLSALRRQVEALQLGQRAGVVDRADSAMAGHPPNRR